jgi:peptidoglycan-associated lipoprotein
MRKKMWMVLALFFVVPGLLFTVSCAKKTVMSESAMTEESAEDTAAKEAADEAAEAAAEAAKLAEETELEAQRIKEENAQREIARAREMFVNEDIYFSFDNSALSAAAQEMLRRKAAWLRSNPGASVSIEGHCDNRGTNEYNLALGDRRAESTKSFLVDLGIAGSRLTTISYGEENPIDGNQNEEAWAKNRRAHFELD